MHYLRFLLMLGVICIAFCAHAVIDTYEFNNDTEQTRFKNLVEELRCPKCQNQNLAGSNSAIANDLRVEVYRLISEGRSDDMIVAHLVARYGEFVRYRPTVDSRTVWLWYSPLAMLLVGLVLAVLIARSSGNTKSKSEPRLTAAERKRLDKISRGQS